MHQQTAAACIEQSVLSCCRLFRLFATSATAVRVYAVATWAGQTGAQHSRFAGGTSKWQATVTTMYYSVEECVFNIFSPFESQRGWMHGESCESARGAIPTCARGSRERHVMGAAKHTRGREEEIHLELLRRILHKDPTKFELVSFLNISTPLLLILSKIRSFHVSSM
jgi:hypothetical protein